MRSLFAPLIVFVVSCGIDLAPAPVAPPRPLPPQPAAADERCGATCRPLHASITTNGYATCTVRADGRVFCWGDISGDGADTSHDVPFALHGVSDAVQVSLARDSTGSFEGCLLRHTGDVMCWGGNTFGQVDPTSPGTAHHTPTLVGGVPPAVEVRVLGDITCALTEAGALFCWGSGEAESASTPFAISGVDDAIHMGTGGACVVKHGGTVACAAHAPSSPSAVDWRAVPDVTEAERVIEIEPYRCAIRAKGDPICWEASSSAEKIAMPALKDAIDIQGSTSEGDPGKGRPLSGCVLRRDRTVACTRDARKTDPPDELTNLAGSVALAYDPSFQCVLRANDDVFCRGTALLGVSFHGVVDHPEPADVPGLEDVVEVRAAMKHTCARTKAGKVLCWGKVPMASAGTSGEEHTTPFELTAVTNAVALRAGDDGDCASRRDGSVACWGRAPGGLRKRPFGAPLGLPYKDFAALKGVRDVTQIAIGNEVCGVQSSGRVVCWKMNDRFVARALGGVGDATQVEIMDADICVVRRSGKVACQEVDTALSEIPGIKDASRITSSGIVLRKDGTLQDFDWGLSGLVVKDLFPAISDARDIDGGDGQGCVVRSDGHVACWGSNSAGQLGDGTYERRDTPVVVHGIADAVEVACGDAHTCALRKNGHVACWGSKYEGRLGAGPIEGLDVTSPVRVVLPQ